MKNKIAVMLYTLSLVFEIFADYFATDGRYYEARFLGHKADFLRE